jgi:CheY-like chemotaxis protein
LALVRHLVELHGGAVRCFSAGLGMGSRFEVRLPVQRAASDAQVPAGDAVQCESGQLSLMVVDDNIDAATTLAMLLRASGHEVRVEHASMSALEAARAAPPDACLLDIGLPEIDGNELARRLHGDPRTAGIVLIAVTGYGQEHDRDTAAAAGFRHHLVKPVDIDKLAATLASVRLSAFSASG